MYFELILECVKCDFVTKGVQAAQAYVETDVMYIFSNVMQVRIGPFLLSTGRNIFHARMAFLLLLVWSRTFSPQPIIMHRYLVLFGYSISILSIFTPFGLVGPNTVATVFDRFIFRRYLLNRF